MGSEGASGSEPSDEGADGRARALNLAAAEGDLAAVQALLATDPGLADREGPHPFWGGRPRPLHVAVEWGHEEVVGTLLAAGADPAPDSSAYDGWTPLFLAASKGHETIARMLRAAGARPDVWTEAMDGDGPTLGEMLQRDPTLVSARGPNGATPLHFAGSVTVAELLVRHGADLGARDEYGSTPLRVAAYSRHTPREVATYLHSLVAERDIFLSCALDDRGAVAAAIDVDAGVLEARDEHLNTASARGATLLHLAAALSNLEMATMLLDRGADPNVRAAEGETPLHYAARFGDRSMAELLIARGANLHTRDNAVDGTPAAWADFFGHIAILPLLEGRTV